MEGSGNVMLIPRRSAWTTVEQMRTYSRVRTYFHVAPSPQARNSRNDTYVLDFGHRAKR